MPSALKVTVRNPYELRQLAQNLKRVKGNLRKETGAALRKSGQATLRKVKTNVTTMRIVGFRVPGAKRRFPASFKGDGGIRRRIARVVELDVSTGSGDPRVVFRVRSDRLGNARNMPRRLDSGKRFRHPIMGKNPDGSWRGGAASRGQPFFRKTILRDLPGIRDDIDDAIDRVADKIRP